MYYIVSEVYIVRLFSHQMPSKIKSSKCKIPLRFFERQLLLHTNLSNKIMCKLAYKNPGFFKKKWNSLHARLNNHYKTQSYEKKKHKKIKAYRKFVQKEPTVQRCLLILGLKPFTSQVKENHSIGREFQSLAVRGKKLLT